MGIIPMGNSDLFPRGKSGETESRYPTLINYWLSVCLILVWPYRHQLWGLYYFTTDGYGIFNVHTHLCACRTHEGGSATNKSAQVDSEGQKKCLSPCPTRGSNRPRLFRFEFWCTNHWATPHATTCYVKICIRPGTWLDRLINRQLSITLFEAGKCVAASRSFGTSRESIWNVTNSSSWLIATLILVFKVFMPLRLWKS